MAGFVSATIIKHLILHAKSGPCPRHLVRGGAQGRHAAVAGYPWRCRCVPSGFGAGVACGESSCAGDGQEGGDPCNLGVAFGLQDAQPKGA